jgi:hypothetical protein
MLKLKTAWRDGTTHLVMSPLESMQRQIEWPVCGIQICECYVRSGSEPAPPIYGVNGAVRESSQALAAPSTRGASRSRTMA